MKYKLLTTTHCPSCPAAKQWAKENLENCEIIDVHNNKEGLDLAIRLNIKQVPTFIDEENNVFTLYDMECMIK
jgi:glutaredoxin